MDTFFAEVVTGSDDDNKQRKNRRENIVVEKGTPQRDGSKDLMKKTIDGESPGSKLPHCTPRCQRMCLTDVTSSAAQCIHNDLVKIQRI